MADQLGSLLKRALGEVAAGADLEAEEEIVLDSECGCRLPPGAWGHGGWHLARTTPESLGREFKKRFFQDQAHLPLPRQQAAWEGWEALERSRGRLDDNGIHAAWKLSAGTIVAYERCPESQARKQEQAQQLRLNAVTSRAAKPRLD